MLQPGDVQCPILPNNHLTRKIREEIINKELYIKPQDRRDVIRTIEQLSLTAPYVGLIHAIGSRPFYVFYSLPVQLHSYKEYCRVNRNSSFICVDATGSLVQKLPISEGGKTGHICLYSILINFDKTTLSVPSMLSEKHDTELIEYWLKQWMRKGALKPKEAICDYSRALPAALYMVFNNNHTIKSYIDICFHLSAKINSATERQAREIHTLIRVDVAHLIHLVSRWACFKKLRYTSVREFYIRCVALMVDCQSRDEFEHIFLLTCTVSLHGYEDNKVDLSIASTAKKARK